MSPTFRKLEQGCAVSCDVASLPAAHDTEHNNAVALADYLAAY